VSGDEPDAAQEPPPVLGSWPRAYAVLLIELALTVALLYLLARWAS
jgi:hypothetical protein